MSVYESGSYTRTRGVRIVDEESFEAQSVSSSLIGDRGGDESSVRVPEDVELENDRPGQSRVSEDEEDELKDEKEGLRRLCRRMLSTA